MTKRLAIVGIFLAVFAGRAGAQTPAIKPASVKTATGQLGASINNAGLQQSFDFSATRKLTTSTHPWLSDARVAVGGTLAATPAGVRGGPWLELAPLSVFVVRAGVEPGQYFGTFHSLTSFDTRLDVFDPDARKARGDAASGRTMKWYVSQTLQLRAGHVVARATFNNEWWSSNARGPMFYEPTRDTLLAADGDRIASMSSAILYQKVFSGGGQFMFGPTHSIMRVDGNQLNKVQKAGLLAVRQLAGKHLGLSRPSLSAQASYFIDDPSKQGQWGGAVAIGFSLGKR